MKSKAKLLAACAAFSAAGLLTAATFFSCSEKEEHIVGKDESGKDVTLAGRCHIIRQLGRGGLIKNIKMI